MVIRHDDRHAQILRSLKGLYRGNSVVTGQDRIDPLFRSFIHKALVDAVSVPESLGKPYIRLDPKASKRVPEDKGGTDSVHIVIPDDPDPLSLSALHGQNIYSFVSIRQQCRVVKIFQRSPEKLFCGFFPYHIPVPDQARKHGRDPAGLCYFVKIRPLGGYDPLLFLQDSLHL